MLVLFRWEKLVLYPKGKKERKSPAEPEVYEMGKKELAFFEWFLMSKLYDEE